MKSTRRFWAAAMAAAAMSGAAWACEEPVALEPAQARELLDLIKNPEGDSLDQVFGFETLMCAKRPAIRDLAVRTALASPNKTLQSSVMFELFFAKEALLVEFTPEEGREKDYYEYLSKNPTVTFKFGAKNRAASCITLPHPSGTRDCGQDGSWNVIQISGTRVQILYGDAWRGDLELNGSELVGTISGSSFSLNRKPLGAAPIRVRLID